MRIPVFLAFVLLAVSSTGLPAWAKSCGGAEATTCAADEWCRFPDGNRCGEGGVAGTCEKRPEICTKEFMPVCGCDGMFYSNSCMAHMGGADVAIDGFCPGKQKQ
ncbi:MAG: Kazal domain-containing protein [Hyphomicrobiales bacterium]